MNRALNLKQYIKKLYYLYKGYIPPILTIFICFFIIFKIIIPQLKDFYSVKQEEKKVEEKIKVFRKNLDFLTNINDSELDSRVGLVSQALPTEKDFTSILNAVSDASNKSNVAVGDFDFEIGDLSTKSARLAKRPDIKISLDINGGISLSKQFITELSKKLPLSETNSVKLTDKSSSIEVSFYYQPFSQIGYDQGVLLKDMSAEDRSLIEKLSLWQVPSDSDFSVPSTSIQFGEDPFNFVPISTPSAQ